MFQSEYCLFKEKHFEQTFKYISNLDTSMRLCDNFRIIPIYLVHRPSNDIPYATLEEELRGDFVKYSVRDGKEINLMRRDSEAGQKCCTFQHWVYHKTEGNLLVTDMQGGLKRMVTHIYINTCTARTFFFATYISSHSRSWNETDRCGNRNL